MVVHYSLTQLSVKQHLKKFSKKCVNAVTEEMKKMHDMKTSELVNLKDLSGDEIMECLESIIFLNDKRDGRIKFATAQMDGSNEIHQIIKNPCHLRFQLRWY